MKQRIATNIIWALALLVLVFLVGVLGFKFEYDYE